MDIVLQIRTLLTSVSISVRQGSYSWSVFPFILEYMFVSFRANRKMNGICDILQPCCHAVAVSFEIFHCWSLVLWFHQSAGFLAVTQTTRSPVLQVGAVSFVTNTYHSFNPRSAVSSSAQPHIHFHSYCIHINPNISVTNLYISCRLFHSDLSNLSVVQNCTEIM